MAAFTEQSSEKLEQIIDPEICAKFGVESLRDKQEEVLQHLMSKSDVLAILPTGFGKSLIYQIFPHVLETPSCVLIVSPLVSLMKDQIDRLTLLGFSAKMARDIQIDRKLPTYIYGTPEDYLQGTKHTFIDMLHQHHGDKIVLLVVDEVHTIPKWGEISDANNKSRRKAQEGAFRAYFSHVGELRSFFPGVVVLALTATASKGLQNQIKESLIIPDCKVVNVCPNRDNIRLSVLKIQRDIPSTFYWMVDKLREDQHEFPRTIVYCSSIDATGTLYHFFKEEYPQSVDYIGMYHSETDNTVQESHLKEFTKLSTSNLRLIFCTTALGMGIDMKSTYHVLHYGPSFYLESYIQESGRVGRDGKPSHAVLFYHGGMLRDICPKLKSYVKNDTLCRRVKLFEDFASSKDLSVLKNKESHHNCCDICERNCSCSNCDSHANYIEKYMVHYCADTESDESSDDTGSLESDSVLADSSQSSCSHESLEADQTE
ncbi:uncharacterized protein LOC102810047 [Saccoglossus kowalevskii]|uniref:DNA 3'-5' helicase n=1 Tax=Saccoglossus kowalevskii TaxID=10224 RepID=A0ABM0MZG2_SACKO|nr:PREDICTED: mediator of RNA polymerase II transcription subunit 34-like [Saccoglossus kowalevskii]